MNDPFADVRGMIGRTRSSVCSAFGVLQPQITNCTYEESIACPAPALHLAEAVGVVAADGVLALRPELPDDSRRVSRRGHLGGGARAARALAVPGERRRMDHAVAARRLAASRGHGDRHDNHCCTNDPEHSIVFIGTWCSKLKPHWCQRFLTPMAPGPG
jgi:hypothetical protein